MDKIANIKVLSIDLFRTLIDVDQYISSIWKTLLKEKYSEEHFQKCRGRFNEIITRQFIEAGSDDRFKTERSLFEDTFKELSAETNLYFSPESAAEVLIEVHKGGKLYDDTVCFLQTAVTKYKLCLSSDCDRDMIPEIPDFRLFDHMFSSEELKSYKLNRRFFDQVVEHYGLKPVNILHIGDSISDVIGAGQCGIPTFWLNRNNRKWNNPVRPDFEGNKLNDILILLETKGDPG
jgi:HAD superfamily hydrolase (TIGR01549 family)